jgi:hypothetical protein
MGLALLVRGKVDLVDIITGPASNVFVDVGDTMSSKKSDAPINELTDKFYKKVD